MGTSGRACRDLPKNGHVRTLMRPTPVHASERSTRTTTPSYPFIISASGMFISITNQLCFRNGGDRNQASTQTGGWLPSAFPGVGQAREKVSVVPGPRGACLPPLSAEFWNPREHSEIQRKNTSLFFVLDSFIQGLMRISWLSSQIEEPRPRDHPSAFSNTPTKRI